MDWNDLIQNNFSAITGLIGVMIGLLLAPLQELVSKRMEKNQKELEHLKEYREVTLVNPIISFIDELLALMSKTYWSALDGEQVDIKSNLVPHREKEAGIKARVLALKDARLAELFDELSQKYGLFWKAVRENELSQSFDEKREAERIAAEIFDRIKPQFRK